MNVSITTSADLRVFTNQQLMRLFGVSNTTVRNWKARGMPTNTDGSYPVPEIIQWWKEKELSRQLHVEEDGDIQGLRMRKIAAETLKIEKQHRGERQKNDELEGKLIQEEVVEREAARWATGIKHELMPLGTRIAALVPGELKATTKKQVKATLQAAYTSLVAGKTLEEMIVAEAKRIGESDKETE